MMRALRAGRRTPRRAPQTAPDPGWARAPGAGAATVGAILGAAAAAATGAAWIAAAAAGASLVTAGDSRGAGATAGTAGFAAADPAGRTASGPAAVGAHAASGAPSPAPVLVELFTSQGCSSCPPADAVLRSLERNQPAAGAVVIPLSQHVDYWDRLGWRDPFSSPRATARQRIYAAALGLPSLYTPMLVVDGRTAVVGSDAAAARRAIVAAAARPRTPVTLQVTGAASSRVIDVAAGVGGDPGARTRAAPRPRPILRTPSASRRLAGAGGRGGETPAPARRAPAGLAPAPRAAGPGTPAGDEVEVWLAVTESGLQTDVRAGENRFRRLRHTGVVRHIERIATGPVPEPAAPPWRLHRRLRLDRDWSRDRLRVVVFLQHARTAGIAGAAAAPVGG